MEPWRAEGSPVLAPIDGTAVQSATHPSLGEFVIVCGEGRCVLLAHLRVRLVKDSTPVAAGRTLIGGVGRTGLPASGVPHLHVVVTTADPARGYDPSAPSVPFRFERCSHH